MLKLSSYANNPLNHSSDFFWSRYTELGVGLGEKSRALILEILRQNLHIDPTSPRDAFLKLLAFEWERKGLIIPEQLISSEEDHLDAIQPMQLPTKGFFQLPTAAYDVLPEHTDLVFFGVPSDLHSPKQGAALGPDCLRRHSLNFAFRDDKPQGIMSLSSQKNPFQNRTIFDIGNINFKQRPAPYWMARLQEVTVKLPKATIPFMIGGDHAYTLSVLRGLHQKRQKVFTLVQLDAHFDMQLSGEFLGTKHRKLMPVSHSNFISHAKEEGLIEDIVQIGVKNYQSLNSFDLDRTRDYCHDRTTQISDLDIHRFGRDAYAGRLPAGKDIYLSLDVDVMAQALIPDTGHPNPTGLDLKQILLLLEDILERNKVIGVDLMEFAPRDDSSQHTAVILGTIMLFILERIRWS